MALGNWPLPRWASIGMLVVMIGCGIGGSSDDDSDASSFDDAGDNQPPGNIIKYCSVDKSRTEALCTAECLAEDAAGEYTDGEWEITCDFVGGCGAESWGQWFSIRVLEASDVGVHTVSLRARRSGGEWTPQYTFPVMIDYVQSRMTFVDASAQVRVYGTTEYISRLAAACFPEFSAASIPGSISDADYTLERNNDDDGQPATTEMFNCIRDNAIATPAEAPLLSNYLHAEGKLPEERLTGVNASTVILVQVVFW